LLAPYTNEVCYLNLKDWSGRDLLDLPYSCVVMDGRAEDLTGQGMATFHATQFFPPRPVLCLYDPERNSDWDIAMMEGGGLPVVMVPYSPEAVEPAITEFMRDPVKYDADDLDNWIARMGERKPKTMMQLQMILTPYAGVEGVAQLTVEELSYLVGDGFDGIAKLLSLVTGSVRRDLLETNLQRWRRIYETDRRFVKMCLAASYTPVGAKRWWTTRRKRLDGQTPNELWDVDRDRVVELAMASYVHPLHHSVGKEDSR